MTAAANTIRRFAIGLACLSIVGAADACASDYPTRPIRLLVGFAAGGPADIISRLTAQWLSERFGQPVIVENRPGAGGNLAIETGVRSSPDGYTLLHISTTTAANATLYDNLSFDLTRDIVPIASIMRGPGVMEVTPSFPARSVPEFIAYAKANPGKINVASAGPGSVPHLYAELFKMMAGVDFVQVHYRGSGPALLDLIGGQVQGMFDPLSSSIGYLRAGKLRPLAVTSGMRSDALPDVPTVGDFVTGYEASAWQGIATPRNTPPEVIERLNREINSALADPKFRARLADLGAIVFASSPSDFKTYMATEIEKWGKVVRTANIKLQ